MTGALIVLFGIISMVMIHEGGHFLAAKAFGMKATEFFFGFGPKLWSTRRGETEYGIKAIPLGGYVRIVGMNPYEEVEPEDEGRTYRERPFWQKSVVVLAGVASHFVVAFLLFFMVFAAIGIDRQTTTVAEVVDELDDGSASPALLAGVEPGDTIVAVDGELIEGWDGLVSRIAAMPGDDVVFTVVRDGAEIDLAVTLASVERTDGTLRGFLGVSPTAERQRVGPLTAIVDSGGELVNATAGSARGMWQLVTGVGDLVGATVTGNTDDIDDVRPASPIGLIRLGAETERFGLATTLSLVALVNVFVGLFNVIPIFPLDGGHFAVALYEKVRGRPADVRKLAPIAAAVVAFMVLLGVLAIFLDITSPFSIQ